MVGRGRRRRGGLLVRGGVELLEGQKRRGFVRGAVCMEKDVERGLRLAFRVCCIFCFLFLTFFSSFLVSIIIKLIRLCQ